MDTFLRQKSPFTLVPGNTKRRIYYSNGTEQFQYQSSVFIYSGINYVLFYIFTTFLLFLYRYDLILFVRNTRTTVITYNKLQNLLNCKSKQNSNINKVTITSQFIFWDAQTMVSPISVLVFHNNFALKCFSSFHGQSHLLTKRFM